jgi:hypothetical protein
MQHSFSMDLIAIPTLTDLVAGVSLSMMIGVLGTALMANFQPLWALWSAHHLVQTFVNTTLVVLQNTEVVWKPVVNASLVVLKPIVAFALDVLKPFGPLALSIANSLVKSIVILGITTARIVLSFVRYLQSAGINVTLAMQSFAQGTKDFAVSVGKIVQWLGFFVHQAVQGVSFFLESCEQVGQFLHRVLHETNTITWDDVYNISIPFFVVATVVGFFVWRATSGNPSSPYKKSDDACIMPRRSSRIARKRAMMLCSDASFASEKPSSRTPTMAGGGQRTPNL